jgi:hypothetical protein
VGVTHSFPKKVGGGGTLSPFSKKLFIMNQENENQRKDVRMSIGVMKD